MTRPEVIDARWALTVFARGAAAYAEMVGRLEEREAQRGALNPQEQRLLDAARKARQDNIDLITKECGEPPQTA